MISSSKALYRLMILAICVDFSVIKMLCSFCFLAGWLSGLYDIDVWYKRGYSPVLLSKLPGEVLCAIIANTQGVSIHLLDSLIYFKRDVKIALNLRSGESFILLSRSFDTAKMEKEFDLSKHSITFVVKAVLPIPLGQECEARHNS